MGGVRVLAALLASVLLALPVQAAPLELVSTTAYTEGKVCCKGDRAREGIVAGKQDWYGAACVVYRAIPDGKGYKVGRALGIYEVLDTGYGKSTRDGIPSAVRKDKPDRGTIEIGRCIDRYSASLDSAKAWMQETGGVCYIQIVKGKG